MMNNYGLHYRDQRLRWTLEITHLDNTSAALSLFLNTINPYVDFLVVEAKMTCNWA
jgi:hypothetical protein